jgi:CysZ protein
MNLVTKALIGALRNLFHPVVLGVVLVPMIGAIVAWLGIAWWFWDSWTAWIQSGISEVGSIGWAAHLDLSRFAGAAATVILLLLLAPAIIGTATLIAALFAMPVLVEHVARRDYPALERRKGGTMTGSLLNAFVALGGFALLWIVTLPAWLFVGPLAAAIPWALSAWLNQRLFRYDALSEHASAAEMRLLFESRFGGLFGLGLITGLMYFVPVVNLVTPVFAALAFTQFGLEELQRLRADGGNLIEGEVIERR